MIAIKKGPLNPYQKHACRKYGGGDFAHLADDSLYGDDIEQLWNDISGCGDTLFIFLMIELSTEEDCEDADEAERRVRTAIRDLEDLVAGSGFSGLA